MKDPVKDNCDPNWITAITVDYLFEVVEEVIMFAVKGEYIQQTNSLFFSFFRLSSKFTTGKVVSIHWIMNLNTLFSAKVDSILRT